MMKAKKLILGAMAIAASATIVLVACNKKLDEKRTDRALTAGTLAACDCTASIKDSTLTGNITSNLFLRSAVKYHLSSLVFVTNGATLTIERGTTIVGELGVPGPGGIGGTPGGGLVITRGAKIDAQGTAQCPIVFTSGRTSGPAVPGDWSGVVLLGKAQTNNAPANVEGIDATAFPGVDIQYGSTDASLNNDTSGILKYVRIEYAGYALSLNNEINALTLAGVGNGTTIDHVEAFKSNDDAFEFFGGCVNASHLLSIDALDDMFDTDNGYTGSVSFALGLADPTRRDQSQSNGFENDNNATGAHTLPLTHPHYSHVTIIGVVKDSSSVQTISGALTLRYGRAGHMRRNARFDIDSSIVFGYNYGISVDEQLLNATDNSLVGYTNCEDRLNRVFSAGYGTTATPGVGAYARESNGIAATGAGFNTTALSVPPCATGSGNTVAGSMTSNNPFSFGNPYVRPTGASPAITNFVPANTPPNAAVRAVGAFPNGTSWLNDGGCPTDNWSRFQ